MSFPTSNKFKGLTLIELLVVVAIVGILASLTLVAMTGTKARARDRRRLEDVNTLRNALSLYYAEHRNFPVPTEGDSNSNGKPDCYLTGSDSVSSELTNADVIGTAVIDPVNSGNYRYFYEAPSSGEDFVIKFYLETNSLQDNGYPQGENTITP